MIPGGRRSRTVRLWRPLLALFGASLLGACVITEPPLGQEEEPKAGPGQPSSSRGRLSHGLRGTRCRALPSPRPGIIALARAATGIGCCIGSTRAGVWFWALSPGRGPRRDRRESGQPSGRIVSPGSRRWRQRLDRQPGAWRRVSDPIRWQWPAQGRLQAIGIGSGKQGVEIVGEIGQAIRAAAAGQVVYSGDGLVGYGRLIIIKHDDTYFSAYAHNRRLLVREGIRVSGGQPIAEMGSTGTNQVKLYFEIRRNGKAVPPRDYLPERQIRWNDGSRGDGLVGDDPPLS